ncbi:MAG: hypothetical protein ABW185_12210 [Sedimenticola sp.]
MDDFEAQDRREFTLRPSQLDFHAGTSTPINRKMSQKRQRIGSDQCPKCEQIITNSTNTYSCSMCDMKYCFRCTNISIALNEAIQEDEENIFKWTCTPCKHNFPSMSNIKSSFQVLDQKNDARMNKIEETIDNINIQFSAKVKEEVSLMKTEVVKEITGELMEKISKEVKTEIHELEEQRLRMLNLTIFNMPESIER